MFNLSKISNVLTHVFSNGEYRSYLQKKVLSKDVTAVIGYEIAEKAKKSDYREAIAILKALGHSQKDIAGILGISQSYVSKLLKK